jgi:hypothetical protein
MRILFALLSVAAAMAQCVGPAYTIITPVGPSTDLVQGLFFTSFWASNYTEAADLNQNPVLSACSTEWNLMVRPTGNGSTYLALNKQQNYEVREFNAYSVIAWSLSMDSINSQLSSLGLQTIEDFNHDAIRLPNGWTATIGHVEQLMAGYQCGPGIACDVLGDAIVVVDSSGALEWYWNSFHWNTPSGLPWDRPAILGETCTPASVGGKGGGGCPITLAPVANDWLHANSLFYDTDGNLIVSLRHQDWAIKINYDNGYGDGHIIWRLGDQGDFAMLTTTADPWFSHQHDVERESNGWISVFDNGNTRQAASPGAHSRGQALIIDEQAMTASLGVNIDLGTYSPAYGSAQLLSNGNWWFMAGIANTQPSSTQATEFSPSGQVVYKVSYSSHSYRSFRLQGLFY